MALIVAHLNAGVILVVTVIIIMYIYHPLINALSAQIISIINLKYNMLYTRRGRSYQNNLHKALYGNTHARTHTHTLTIAEIGY